MNILLVGSGGREHSLALKLAETNSEGKLFIAPGNAGTAQVGENVKINPDAINELADFAFSHSVDLVVVGPEVPLSLGLSDLIAERNKQEGRNVFCFGPSKKASQIEWSKAFAKKTMIDLKIPTAKYSVFSDFEKAAGWVQEADYDFVIKVSGLAAGKGVFLPTSKEEAIGILYQVMNNKTFGEAGAEVVLEERLTGEEVSILAFSDGKHISVMPSSQDHKRIGNNDTGPNTGGMGAYAPAPVCPYDEAESLANTIIAPLIKKLADDRTPYIGVVYAGLMLTSDGAKVIEYNCRFGDPEAQVLMELFEGNLSETMIACCKGELPKALPNWKTGYAATVIMAKNGYPQKSSNDVMLDYNQLNSENDVKVVHSGTAEKNGKLYAHGGRVLSVTGYDKDLENCMQKIYNKIQKIDFPNCQYRNDISERGINFLKKQLSDDKSFSYSCAGVDIDAGNLAVKLMSEAVKSTYTPEVLSRLGSFGGLFDISAAFKNMNNPIMVASTDGVGTKVKLGSKAKSYESIGMDIVNHCIDDILVQGAKPLFFLDYFAASKLDPKMASEIVVGMSKACKNSNCALIGGETAEMPGVYVSGEFDIAGTIVGITDREKLLPKNNIGEGDVLIGLASDSPHTNGYSLIRKIFEDVPLETVYPELGTTLKEALLKPHRCYLKTLYPILQNNPEIIKGLAHITGGGFFENIPRVIPNGLNIIVNKAAWDIPPLYKLIQKTGNIEENEMYRIFNMGIGMIAIVAPENSERFQKLVGEKSWVLGKLEKAETKDAKAQTFLQN